jgi:hypothetical protein
MQKNVRRFFYVAILLCLTAIFASARAPQQPGANEKQPHVYVPYTEFNFGDIYKGEIISQIFLIKNEGNADLVIKEFSGNCGCEVTRADTLIAPGKTGQALIEINTASQSGDIIKLATLRTNDLEKPNIVLTLQAKVLTSPDGGPVKGVALRAGKHIGPIFLGPDTRDGRNLAVGEKGKPLEFTVTAERSPLKVLRVEGGGKYYAARIDVVEEGKRYKIIAEPISTATPGAYTEQLHIITDSPMLPSVTVYAVLVVRPN